MQDLSTLSGEFATRGVSADGSVIVGYAHPANTDRYAFRWTQATGMVNLGTLGGNWSEARGVSADGTIVTGYAIDTRFRRRPFRWTQAAGMQDIAPETFARGEANAIAFNGSAIVGEVEARVPLAQ
jgi:probable extracellular repeat, HAF family